MHVDVREERGRTIATVRGVVDVGTAPDLLQVLQGAQLTGGADLLLELDGVELLDAFGLGVLVDVNQRARARGGELVLVVTRERLLEVFARSQLDQILRLVADVEDVLGT